MELLMERAELTKKVSEVEANERSLWSRMQEAKNTLAGIEWSYGNCKDLLEDYRADLAKVEKNIEKLLSEPRE